MFFFFDNFFLTYLSRVSGVGVVVDGPAQPEVGDLADEVLVDQDVPCGEVAVDVAHVGQVLHPARDPVHHLQHHRHLQLIFVLLLLI